MFSFPPGKGISAYILRAPVFCVHPGILDFQFQAGLTKTGTG